MESPYSYSPPTISHVDASRPSFGFPLGTALFMIVIFSLSGIFSCCYHWDKARSHRRSISDDTHPDGSQSKSTLPHTENQSLSLPVLMPGDQVAKFIALPCPCQPPRPNEKIVIRVEQSTSIKPLPQPMIVPSF